MINRLIFINFIKTLIVFKMFIQEELKNSEAPRSAYVNFVKEIEKVQAKKQLN